MPRREEAAHQEIHGTRLSARAVYQAVRRDGEGELERPPASLWWSGIAAGVVLSSSVLAKALLHQKLPEAEWRPLVENLGYAVGFVLVILGRMQLFTENTITVVLPLVAERSRRVLLLTARLWALVLAANLVGTLLAALGLAYGLATPAQLEALHAVSRPLVEKDALEMLLHAIPAGFLVALIVWMLPNARGFELWVILLITYLIGLGEFAHVVVGAVEAFLLLLAGEIGLAKAAWGFLLPVFAGNVLGGTALLSLLAYAQVRQEID